MKNSILFLVCGTLILLFCSCSQSGKMQSTNNLDSLDNALAQMYERMWEEGHDLPYEFADTFEMRMEEMLQDTTTFTYAFDSLRSANVRIVESDDRSIRIYWWSDPYSGTWRRYPAIFQLRTSAGGLKVQNAETLCGEDGFPDQAFHALYHLRDSLYLVRSGGSFSSMMPYESAFGYVLSETGAGIAENLLMDPEGDTLRSSIYVDLLWYLENIEKFNNTIPTVMNYDSLTKTLSWPAMRNAETGESMNNNVYSDRDIEPSGDTFYLRFNGEFFESNGVEVKEINERREK